MHLVYTQDVENVLKANHQQRAEESAFAKTPDMRHTMRIPTVFLLAIRNKYGWDYMNKDHWPMVKKALLADYGNSVLTTNKRV